MEGKNATTFPTMRSSRRRVAYVKLTSLIITLKGVEPFKSNQGTIAKLQLITTEWLPHYLLNLRASRLEYLPRWEVLID